MRNRKSVTLTLAVFVASFALFCSSTKVLAVVQNLNGQTGQTQTFQNDSNVTISSSNNAHSIVWQGQLPVSRGGTGANSFTAGSVLFSDGSSITQNNLKLFWDNTNNRLGIGTSSPASTLDVRGDTSISGNLNVTGNITGNLTVTNLVPYTGATGNVDLGSYNLTANSLTSASDSTINSLNIGLGGGSVTTNTSIGKNALLNANSSSTRNTAVGFSALQNAGGSVQSTAVGYYALANTADTEGNTAIGDGAMTQNISGSYNTGIGARTLMLNTSGNHNVAVGYGALNGSGDDNVALGFASLGNNTSSANIAIGSNSFATNITGDDNIAIGTYAATAQADGTTYLTGARQSIYIGRRVLGYDNNDFNSIVIGDGAVGAGANKTVIGNSSMSDVYFGSAAGLSNIHATKMFLGSSTRPGCIIMGDSDGNGVTYITVNDGAISASATPPSTCQ